MDQPGKPPIIATEILPNQTEVHPPSSRKLPWIPVLAATLIALISVGGYMAYRYTLLTKPAKKVTTSLPQPTAHPTPQPTPESISTQALPPGTIEGMEKI